MSKQNFYQQFSLLLCLLFQSSSKKVENKLRKVICYSVPVVLLVSYGIHNLRIKNENMDIFVPLKVSSSIRQTTNKFFFCKIYHYWSYDSFVYIFKYKLFARII